MIVWTQALLDEKPILDIETAVPSDNLPVAVEKKVFLCKLVLEILLKSQRFIPINTMI